MVSATLVGLKHSEANLLKISTSSLCLRVAQMPRSQDLMIFMLTMTIDGQTALPPCTCRVKITVPKVAFEYSIRSTLYLWRDTWVNTSLAMPYWSISQNLNSTILITPTKVDLVAYVRIVTTLFSHQLQHDHTSFKTCGRVS